MRPSVAESLNSALGCDILKREVGPALSGARAAGQTGFAGGTKRGNHNWRRLGCFRFPFRPAL